MSRNAPDPAPGQAPLPHGDLPVAHPAAPPDTAPDGIERTITAFAPGKAWFPETTDVFFVNGIAMTDRQANNAAGQYADVIHHAVTPLHVETHGRLNDIGISALETHVPAFAYAGAPERALAGAVLDHIAHGKEMHIMAYSRGALVTQRGLELAEMALAAQGMPPEEIEAKLGKTVTLETVNGASHDVPAGIRAVHYVRDSDALVSEPLGESRISPAVRGVLTEVSAIGGLGLTAVMTASEVREGVANRPGGPVVFVPATGGDLMAQHDFGKMLPALKPFDQMRAQYEREQPHRPEGPAPQPRESLGLAEHTPASIREALPSKAPNGLPYPAPVSVEPWHGKPVSGELFRVDDGTYAMHAGRGAYMTFDVQTHLGGEHPVTPVGRVDREGFAPRETPAPARGNER